jgi:chemotaxis protein CheX
MEQFIQPFIDVCTSVFQEFIKCDLIPERVYFSKREDFLNWDISGLIALSGETKGIVAISMKTPTALEITRILTGNTHAQLDSDVVDMIGELVNIISGNVKKKLEDTYRIIISLPYIIRGKAHLVVIPAARDRLLCIPFTIFTDQTICLSISID